MNRRRFAKARDQQPRGRACSQNSHGSNTLRQASRRTRARESECLPTPRIEAAYQVIVHEQLAGDTKDKEDRDLPRSTAGRSQRVSATDVGLSLAYGFSPARRFPLCGLPY